MNRRAWLSTLALSLPYTRSALAGPCFVPGLRWALHTSASTIIPADGAILLTKEPSATARSGGLLDDEDPRLRLQRNSSPIPIETRNFAGGLLLVKPRAAFTGPARLEGVAPLHAQSMTVRFGRASTPPLPAPVLASVQSGEHRMPPQTGLNAAPTLDPLGRSTSSRPSSSATAGLSAPIPNGAQFFAVFSERRPTLPVACVSCTPNERSVPLFYEVGRCVLRPAGMGMPYAGTRAFAVFIDAMGRLSPPSNTIVVASW